MCLPSQRTPRGTVVGGGRFVGSSSCHGERHHMERSNILGQREATLDDAPVSLSNDAAWNWVSGFNTCRDRMLGHSDAFRAEIQRLREQNQRLQAKYDEVMDTQHGQLVVLIDTLRSRNRELERDIDAWIVKFDEMKANYEKTFAEVGQLEILLAQASQASMVNRRAYLEEHDKLTALMAERNRDRA